MVFPKLCHSPTSPSLPLNLNPASLFRNPVVASSTVLHQRRRRRSTAPLRCSASSFSEKDKVELPIFPLPVVLFPGATIPLPIFETRYRIMIQTLIQTDLRFGVLYTGSPTTGVSDVGCVAEIVQYQRLIDGKFFLICKGERRFCITNIIRQRPYMVAEVKWFDDTSVDVDGLTHEVEIFLKDAVRLTDRLVGEKVEDVPRNLSAKEFSFFVGNLFSAAPEEQQILLELEDTASRLRREKETLLGSLKYLRAASAIEDRFPLPSSFYF